MGSVALKGAFVVPFVAAVLIFAGHWHATSVEMLLFVVVSSWRSKVAAGDAQRATWRGRADFARLCPDTSRGLGSGGLQLGLDLGLEAAASGEQHNEGQGIGASLVLGGVRRLGADGVQWPGAGGVRWLGW